MGTGAPRKTTAEEKFAANDLILFCFFFLHFSKGNKVPQNKTNPSRRRNHSDRAQTDLLMQFMLSFYTMQQCLKFKFQHKGFSGFKRP